MADIHLGARVLVIDDSTTIQRSVQIFLQRVGCEVVLADNGFDALGKIAPLTPDVIFLDVLMPRLDGFQTCALIRRSAKHHRIPIVMLTSKDSMLDRARGRMAGADDLLGKPFTMEALIEVTRRVMQRQPAVPVRAAA